MKTLEQLQTERGELLDELRSNYNTTNCDGILKKINSLDSEITKIKTKELLTEVNRQQKVKREFAQQAWECEQPTEDITCNDGSIHKVKAKKYPILASMQYLRLTFMGNLLTKISINRHNFDMFKIDYSTTPKTYTRPANFEEFLKLNSIRVNDITEEEYVLFSQQLKEANNTLKNAIKEYDEMRGKLDTSGMQNLGLVGQSHINLYEYTPKTGK